MHIQTASPGNSYAAPYDGVLTSWGSRGYFDTITFKAVRLGSAGAYTVVGSDGPRTHAPGIELETYPVRIPVRQGDVLGLYNAPDINCGTSSTDHVVGIDDTDTPVGSTGFLDATYGVQLPLEATIERDRDGDGYGDESQDQCPTNAATHGPCPLPTVLGQTFVPDPSTTVGAFDLAVTGAVGIVVAAPADGVITSWSYQSGPHVDGTLTLKMFRPLGGNDYRVVGADQDRRPAANSLNTYSTRIPVRQGDKIGLHKENVPIASNVSSRDNSFALFEGDLAPGSSETFSASTNGRRIDLSAVLEADADGDGFGDTSQDACPTDASTQGQCPVAKPPAADDEGCAKARKRLKRAKAKLRVLKRKDAATKKVKAAKKRVKKARKAAKAAC